ncbi:hypothetical protein Acr_00g0057230 [Actinidia rufa]|uniref:CASP-like protein n=1 Tax=Actinidia rufa TaxID=165716 RepID=A0A7J0DPI2_9ERIC|nr:hypothetical protein Acr_00g0057230 [Actinidia rufa]
MDSKMAEKNSDIFQITSLDAPIMSSPQHGGFFKLQFMLRVLAIAFTAAAMATMLTSKQSISMFGIVIEARYSYSSAFKFLFAVDVVVCTFSVLSLILVFLLSRSKSSPCRYFAVFLHDLVIAALMMAGCAAGTAIGEVGRDGMNQVGWVAICNRVGKFCDKVTLSVSLSYMVLVCYAALTVLSVHKLKSLAT